MTEYVKDFLRYLSYVAAAVAFGLAFPNVVHWAVEQFPGFFTAILPEIPRSFLGPYGSIVVLLLIVLAIAGHNWVASRDLAKSQKDLGETVRSNAESISEIKEKIDERVAEIGIKTGNLEKSIRQIDDLAENLKSAVREYRDEMGYRTVLARVIEDVKRSADQHSGKTIYVVSSSLLLDESQGFSENRQQALEMISEMGLETGMNMQLIFSVRDVEHFHRVSDMLENELFHRAKPTDTRGNPLQIEVKFCTFSSHDILLIHPKYSFSHYRPAISEQPRRGFLLENPDAREVHQMRFRIMWDHHWVRGSTPLGEEVSKWKKSITANGVKFLL